MEEKELYGSDGEQLEEVQQVITLLAENGEEIEFIEVAAIPLDGKMYAILQPVVLLEGMEEGEALVFEVEISDDGQPTGFNVVLDDELIDQVFAIYNEMVGEVAVGENN